MLSYQIKNTAITIFRGLKMMWPQTNSNKGKVAIIVLCCLLTACGFHPLYRSGFESSDICFPLKIATIPDRKGQILRNYLVDSLTPKRSPANPDHILETKLTESVRSIGVNKDETTNRMEAILTADITLRDAKTNKVVYTHTARAINSFAVIKQNYYSDLIAEDYAKKEAIRLLAEKITLLVTTYLNQIYEN